MSIWLVDIVTGWGWRWLCSSEAMCWRRSITQMYWSPPTAVVAVDGAAVMPNLMHNLTYISPLAIQLCRLWIKCVPVGPRKIFWLVRHSSNFNLFWKRNNTWCVWLGKLYKCGNVGCIMMMEENGNLTLQSLKTSLWKAFWLWYELIHFHSLAIFSMTSPSWATPYTKCG